MGPHVPTYEIGVVIAVIAILRAQLDPDVAMNDGNSKNSGPHDQLSPYSSNIDSRSRQVHPVEIKGNDKKLFGAPESLGVGSRMAQHT